MTKTARQLVCFFVLCIGFVCAWTQVFGSSRDYVNYEEFFTQLTSGGDLDTRFEPGFMLVTAGAGGLTSNVILMYALIVALSLYLKFHSSLVSVRLGAFSIAMLLLLYMIRYFPLHELTQLRIALAIAVLLFGIYILHSGKQMSGSAIILASVAFHYSLIAVVPFVFLALSADRKTLLVRVFLVYAVIAFVTGTLLLLFADYFDVLAAYEANNQIGDLATNPFSAFVLLDSITTIYMLRQWETLDKPGRHFVAVQAMGLAVFFATIGLGVIAIRTREAFSIFYFLGFVRILYCFRKVQILALVLLFANFVLYGYTYFFYKEYPFFS